MTCYNLMYDNFVCSLACHALISQDRHLPYQWVIHRCREFSQHFIKNPHLEPERLTVRPPWKQKELQSSNFENWNLFTARRQKNRNVEKTSLKYVNKQKYSSDQKKKKKKASKVLNLPLQAYSSVNPSYFLFP